MIKRVQFQTMNEIFKLIDSSKHIVVVVDSMAKVDSIASASAIYTFLLQEHKKVSFFCKAEILDSSLKFLPWFENIRNTFPVSADLSIVLGCSDLKDIGVCLETNIINIDFSNLNSGYGDVNILDNSSFCTTQILFNLFKQNNIKINSKMATSLYTGMLHSSELFLSEKVDGTFFAIISELIKFGAKYKISNDFIAKYQTLSSLRVKSVMLSSMTLHEDAQIAVFVVTQKEILSTGATKKECVDVLDEALKLSTVKISVVACENKDSSYSGYLKSNFKKSEFEISSDIKIEDVQNKLINLVKKEL